MLFALLNYASFVSVFDSLGFQYVFSTYIGEDNFARLLSNYESWLSKRCIGLTKYISCNFLKHVTTNDSKKTKYENSI